MESIDVFRTRNKWLIVVGEDIFCFFSTDEAFDWLEKIGIPIDEADTALLELLGHDHTRAQFGVLNGSFIFSDNAKPPIVGTA